MVTSDEVNHFCCTTEATSTVVLMATLQRRTKKGLEARLRTERRSARLERAGHKLVIMLLQLGEDTSEERNEQENPFLPLCSSTREKGTQIVKSDRWTIAMPFFGGRTDLAYPLREIMLAKRWRYTFSDGRIRRMLKESCDKYRVSIIDICSLYPNCMFHFEMPVGHHEIIKNGLEDIECDHVEDDAWYANSTLRNEKTDHALAKLGEYFGMVKCEVTPERRDGNLQFNLLPKKTQTCIINLTKTLMLSRLTTIWRERPGILI